MGVSNTTTFKLNNCNSSIFNFNIRVIQVPPNSIHLIHLTHKPQKNIQLVRGLINQYTASFMLLASAVTVHHGHMPEIALLGPDRATGIWAMMVFSRPMNCC